MGSKSNISAVKRPALSGRYVFAAASILLVGAALVLGRGAIAESAVKIPPPAADVTTAQGSSETAVFAGGCFWGIQAVFQHTRGVTQAVSGYAGGEKNTASYETVSTGSTGHAESVQVTYDPKVISYGKLLQVYFSVAHDPTQLNHQFPDTGTQYRSAVFYKDAQQKQVTDAYIAQLNGARVYKDKIVTQVTPLKAFYAAENYHQDYATIHPDQPYIATYDLPKLGNLKTLFPDLYRDKPVLVAQANEKK
ncbi:MAG: peptide methionine sulfoxide reductase [Betaproteobacteria bacterium]|nr:peptide methionine sulfoxide reductase [Betaproteobacteria bacterium]